MPDPTIVEERKARREAVRAANRALAETLRRRIAASARAKPPGPLTLTSVTEEQAAGAARRNRDGTIGRLARRGALSEACITAAGEINQLYLLREDGQLTVVPLAERVDTFVRGQAPGYLDAVAGQLARWTADLLFGAPAFGGPQPVVYNVTLAVVVYDYSLNEVQKRLGLRRGTPMEYLVSGLQHYADIKAGTVRRRGNQDRLRKRA